MSDNKDIIKKYLNGDIDIPKFISENKYLPSLDGFRAISIFIVVLGHINATIHNKYIDMIPNGGHLGVVVFFVISGFLITSLLLSEKIKSNTISLKHFYIRRALRIFPVASLYLIVLTLLNYFFKLNIPSIAIIGAILYVSNFSFFKKSNFTGHYWSLAVEEQFYLIFPFILKKNLKLFSIIIPLLIIIIFIFKTFSTHKYFFLEFDGVLIGSFFSILLYKSIFDINKLIKNKNFVDIAAIILAIITYKYTIYDSTLSGFFIAILIINNLIKTDTLVFKLLNTRVFKIIGILSYSIYIWQQFLTSNYFNNSNFYFLRIITFYPINIFSILFISILSYYLLEKNILKFKKNFY